TILWGAGVMANPLTKKLGVPLDRGGRIVVNPDLSVPGHPEVFAIGDIATVPHKDGKPVPWVSPAAMQMARHVARIIEDELEWVGRGVPGEPPPRPERPAFKYWDKGTMATIGRSAAVALIGKVKLTGYIAWLAWLFIHLVFLVGLRSKFIVLFNWAYSYFTYKRGARIITAADAYNKQA
ncbi:MAG TPA: FAD-dependent oxidoreductase, partial [Verrucomicrobiae bacterium]|nr:FAD-dependent oxidoreductase [Verrucomicrobiae bacterium]